MKVFKRNARPRPAPYTQQEFHALATYNGERARGLMHKASYRTRMAEVQERYDRWFTDELEDIDDSDICEYCKERHAGPCVDWS